MTYQFQITDQSNTKILLFQTKQIKITNPNNIPIYINFSGMQPNQSQFDCIVHPNEIVITPPISCQNLTYYRLNSTPLTPVSFDCYETASQSPGIFPYQSNQFIPTSNYPVIVPIGTLTSTINLPPVTVDKFQNIFFILRPLGFPVLGGSPSVGIRFLIRDSSNGSSNMVAGFNEAGGVVSYVPDKTGLTLTLTLDVTTPSAFQCNYELNIILTDAILDENFPRPLIIPTTSAGGTATWYAYAKPPYFIYSLFVAEAPPPPPTVNVYTATLDITLGIFAYGLTSLSLPQQALNFTLNSINFFRVIPDKVQYIETPCIIQFDLNILTATPARNIRPLLLCWG